MKKRRMFDVDLPEDEAPAPEATTRRGPMAAAISETADASRERASVEAAIRAENDALAHEFVRLKRLGLITDMIPTDQIRIGKLVRDRSRRVDPEIDDLKTSIRAVGLSNPVRVEPDGQGGYELVEGWRRLSAFRALLEETGEERWTRIPASFVPPGETVEGLYRRMVDENLVRKDISWAEMARLARAYAEDRVGGCEDLDQAVNLLFASANPQKRSYIRRFAALMARLEKVLEYPEAIPRALGLALAQRLDAQPELTAQIAAALRRQPQRTAQDELRILQGFETGTPSLSPRGNEPARPTSRAKTVLRLTRDGVDVKCTASAGRVEILMDHDFSTLDRHQLEAALKAFLAALD